MNNTLKSLEAFANLSGLKRCNNNVYYSIEDNKKDALLIIIDDELPGITAEMYNDLQNCTGKLTIKGKVRGHFSLLYFEGYKIGFQQQMQFKEIDLSELNTDEVTSIKKLSNLPKAKHG